MFVDASALVAMLASETEAPTLFGRLETSKTRRTSPMAVWEASVALSRILGVPIEVAEAEVELLLKTIQIQCVDVPSSTASVALEAFSRFGKGRHPAQLNFGDCFAYACAKEFRLPLLFKGKDFSKTDIAAA